MFGICLLHSLTQGGHNTPFLANILLSCVNGFVFLSGWYGLRFRPSKVFTLYGVACACGVVSFGMEVVFGVYTPTWDLAMATHLGELCLTPWFLNAYLFLMLLAPLVDAALERLPTRLLPSVLLPFFALTFGWSFSAGLPYVGTFVPKTSGLGAYTGLSLLSVYVVARLCRRFEVGQWFTWPRAVLALLVLWCATGIGMGEYSSPFATLLCALCFFLFMRLPWPRWVGRVAQVLGPSMFSIYLLHTNRLGFGTIRKMEDLLIDAHGWPTVPTYLAVTLTLFLTALVLDQPRRLLVYLTRAISAPLLAKLDALYVRFAPSKVLPQA